MDKDFVEVLNSMTPRMKEISTRAFFEKHAPFIRTKMRDLNRPLRDFVPEIRMKLCREADPATGRPADPDDGRVIPMRTAEVYMSEFAPARERAVKAAAQGVTETSATRPSVVQPSTPPARLDRRPDSTSKAASGAPLPERLESNIGNADGDQPPSVLRQHNTDDDRMRRENSVNAKPPLPE